MLSDTQSKPVYVQDYRRKYFFGLVIGITFSSFLSYWLSFLIGLGNIFSYALGVGFAWFLTSWFVWGYVSNRRIEYYEKFIRFEIGKYGLQRRQMKEVPYSDIRVGPVMKKRSSGKGSQIVDCFNFSTVDGVLYREKEQLTEPHWQLGDQLLRDWFLDHGAIYDDSLVSK
jgi:hypothetical protein